MPERKKPGIPAKQWTPWVGDQLSKAWEAAQERISFSSGGVDRNEVIKIMVKAGPLAEITAKQMLQKAVRVGYLRIIVMYNPYDRTGPTIAMNHSCDDKVFDRWNERPVVDKEKRRRRIDALERRRNPLERKYDN